MDTATIHHLEVTVAHHGDNEFYMLGRIMPEAGGAVLDWYGEPVQDVTHEVPPAALFAALPDQSCERDSEGRASCELFCIVLDACDADGDTVADKEIDLPTADGLLDGEFAARLARAQGNLAEWYAYDATRPEGVSCTGWMLALLTSKGHR